jgi:quercetin dioxygenase-like cupin family protein
MNMIRTKLSKVKEIRTPHGKKVRWLISKEMGAPRFEMRHFTITDESQPSEEAHPWEHQVYILSGEGIIKSGDTEIKVEPGDAIYIAPNEPHLVQNLPQQKFTFLCIIPAGCEDRVKG